MTKYFNKTMYAVVSLVIIVATLFYACNDNPINSNNAKTISGFYGILHNYDSAENILDTRLFLDSGYASMGRDTIELDSILNLTLLTPSDNMLKPITEIAKGYGGNLAVSDVNAMGTNYLRLYFFHNYFGQLSGYLQRSNSPANSSYYEGLFIVNFAYCDRNASITGTVINIFSIFGPPDTLKYNVNINLARGWNPVTYYTKTARAYYYEYDVYNDDPEGAKWFYNDNQPGDLIQNEKFIK